MFLEIMYASTSFYLQVYFQVTKEDVAGGYY